MSIVKHDQPLDLNTLEKQFEPKPEDIKNDYNPFRLSKINTYNPIYSRLFNEKKDLDMASLSHRYHIKDLFSVMDVWWEGEGKGEGGSVVNKNIFVKSAPLLDPIRYMIGKYETRAENFVFPSAAGGIEDMDGITNKKLADPNNASYVDNFFCFLTSQLLTHHGFVHGIEYYGSLSGVQQKYKFDISDDFDYLCNSTFFVNNNKRLYVLDNEDMNASIRDVGDTRTNKSKLTVHSVRNLSAASVENLGIDGSGEGRGDLVVEDLETEGGDPFGLEEIYVKNADNDTFTVGGDGSEDESESESEEGEGDDGSDEGSDGSLNYSSNGSVEEGDDDGSWETEDGSGSNNAHNGSDTDCSGSDEDKKEYAFINDFPVQLICLEKCEGTLDELLENDHLSCKEGIAALFQIIMILITYQKAFHFTHNDLHTNNIMYVQTDREYLWYKYENQVWRVPTYGKIYKIIDFGRGIYKYKQNLFCSDSFATDGDAATQYNFEPYMVANKPRIEPNYSFDLCRLGCSIYDFIIDDDCDVDGFVGMDDFQRVVHSWCRDDNGKNVLYKRNGEERYHNFRLYKMIARTVHGHTPVSQLSLAVFKVFLVGGPGAMLPKNDKLIDIDRIPCYV